MTEEHV